MITRGIATAALLIGLAGSGHADVNLWIDDTSGNIGLVDVTTGTVSMVNNTGQALTDIAFVGNQMYGTTFTGLYSINDTTGAAASIAGWGQRGSDQMNALVGDGADLLAATDADGEVFKSTTSGVTSVYTVSTMPSAGDLAFNGGTLYESTLGTGGDALVDVSSFTTIANFSVGGNFLQAVFGLATDSNGVTYAVDGTEIYTVNLSNAVLTPVLDYSGHGLGAANGTAFIQENNPGSVPEPSTWVMLVLGFAGLGYAARRTRDALILAKLDRNL